MQKEKLNSDSIIEKSSSIEELEEAKRRILGKKGTLTLALKALGEIPQSERIEKAKSLNREKKLVLEKIQRRKEEITGHGQRQEAVDITLPTYDSRDVGKLHPLNETIRECQRIFQHLGYDLVQGNCVEDDFHNFDALNMPLYHPARQDLDTFYLESGLLLRTHTSHVEIRFMKENKPPFQIASIGEVFRRGDLDSTHTPVFHQAEAFAVDTGLNMSHLKWTIEEFLGTFFEEKKLCLRFRPSYFPFTEPSAEVDLMVKREENHVQLALEGEKITDNHTWIEVLGCGMLHPMVFQKLGLAPQDGFAMGMGMERLAMLKYHISDVRDMFSNDVQWLAHYGLSPFWCL